MEKPVWNGVAPVDRNCLEERMNLLPVVNSHEYVLRVLALIEYIDIEHFKVYNMDLRMITPQFVPHLIQITVPSPTDKQKIFPVQILRRQSFLGCKRMVDGYRAADGFPGQFQGSTLPDL